MEKADDSSDGNASGSMSLYFGWWALLCYLTLGFTLEILHGLKVGWYLEFETRRLMWTLGHAHGALLALTNVVFGIMVRVIGESHARWQRTAAVCLMLATILLPGGFFLGGIHIYGADPGIGIFLVPLGAVCLFLGVLLTALNARFTSRSRPPVAADVEQRPGEGEGGEDGLRWE